MGKRQIMVFLGGGVPQTSRFKSHPFLASGNLENWGKKDRSSVLDPKGKNLNRFFLYVQSHLKLSMCQHRFN